MRTSALGHGATALPRRHFDTRHQAGDPDAAVAVAFHEFASTIQKSVHGATRDPELAADATQEAFASLLREARAGRYPTFTRAWLYRAAMNVAVSRQRRAAVARRSAPRLVRLDLSIEPEAIALEHERSSDLRSRLARLNQSERTALVMLASGASGEEIAVHLGKTRGATRTLICRARARLRLLTDEQDAA